MLNESRIDLYDYLYNLFFNVVTQNVYPMLEPQELTKSDTEDGFLVIRVGDLHDESEFSGNAYGWARCYVEAFVPPISRGRLARQKYKAFEDSINDVINQASENGGGDYYIEKGSVLSTDADEASNANNAYFTFIKSFVVHIEQEQEQNQNSTNI